MWDPSYASPEDAAQPSGAVPTDPYTSLKQNYEAVIAFLTLVSMGLQALLGKGGIILGDRLWGLKGT
jgi:hypothetical protein